MNRNLTKSISVAWWTATIAWAVLIFYFSTKTFRSDLTQGVLASALRLLHVQLSWRSFELLHTFVRKCAHVTEYAVLASLLYGPPREKGPRRWQLRRAFLGIMAAAAYSLTDEFHQSFVPGRTASLIDCGWDTLGASLAMLVVYTREYVSVRDRPEA